MESGFKTGTLTSPHYKDFRERVKINGNYIPEVTVIEFVETYKSDIENLEASFFEITAALGFWYFAQQAVDIAIVETGLGGRLDSTNILKPELSVITNIGLDHQQFLGNTLEAIALEKAGIIKKNTPVVIGERHPETETVFIKDAFNKQAPIYFAHEMVELSDPGIIDVLHNEYEVKLKGRDINLSFKTDLKGDYQKANIRTALAAFECYKQVNDCSMDDAVLAIALSKIKQTTKMQGKWMVFQEKPLVIADSAHNAPGLKAIFKSIERLTYNKLHIVFGMMKDKDAASILNLLPKSARYYFCSPSFLRAMDVAVLHEKARAFDLEGVSCNSVLEAKQAALKNAVDKDLVLIIGSCFVVAEVI